MSDLFLDGNFDVGLDHRNDLKTVDGRSKFEQDIAVRLTSYLHGELGTYDHDVLKQKIKYQVNRVAINHSLLDSLEKIKVEESISEENTMNVDIVYTSSETFSTSLTI